MAQKVSKLCEGVDPKIKPMVKTLAEAVFAMQEKIEEQISVYAEMPLAQQVKVGTGETMLRANPATQEFRATVRDYAQALNSLQGILENRQADTSDDLPSLDEFRKKFRLAK
jgi:hypothetical protein